MIRNATADDLQSIVEIYNAAIPGRLATADTDPIPVESRRAWLADRDWSHYPVWVCETEGHVAAWLSFSRFYGRPAYAQTAEVSIYVDPLFQRRGLASRLLRHAFERSGSLGIRTFLAFVFAQNDRSLALCHRFGFEVWGHLPRVAVLDGIERDLVILGCRVDRPSGVVAAAGPR